MRCASFVGCRGGWGSLLRRASRGRVPGQDLTKRGQIRLAHPQEPPVADRRKLASLDPDLHGTLGDAQEPRDFLDGIERPHGRLRGGTPCDGLIHSNSFRGNGFLLKTIPHLRLFRLRALYPFQRPSRITQNEQRCTAIPPVRDVRGFLLFSLDDSLHTSLTWRLHYFQTQSTLCC